MMKGSLVVQVPALPGQLDLLAQVDVDRHRRKKTGMAVTMPALHRAQGLLTLLPQSMIARDVTEGADGSIEFTWQNRLETGQVMLRMCCLPDGGVRYNYLVEGKNGGSAGGVAWPSHYHEEVLARVKSVLVLLTPKEVSNKSEVRPQLGNNSV